MKIIAGKYKNRVITTDKKALYKPTTSKFREAVFSILSSGQFLLTNPLDNAIILDLYSGTGILAFEALSRGAKNVTLVDINPLHLKQARNFAKLIGQETAVYCKQLDAAVLEGADQQYDVVFMDPPYYKGLCPKTLNSLIKQKWLRDKSLIVMEIEKKANINFQDFPELRIIKEKTYGNSKLLITEYEQNKEKFRL